MKPGTTEFVERMALFFEAEGFSRIAGRVFGRLLLSDTPLSLHELAGELTASKASVSTETRFLERRGLIERVGKRGDRRVYYMVAPELPVRTMELRLDRMRRFSLLMREAPVGAGRGGGGGGVVRDRLQEIQVAYDHMLEAIGRAIATWRRRMPGAKSAGPGRRPGRRSRPRSSTPA